MGNFKLFIQKLLNKINHLAKCIANDTGFEQFKSMGKVKLENLKKSFVKVLTRICEIDIICTR